MDGTGDLAASSRGRIARMKAKPSEQRRSRTRRLSDRLGRLTVESAIHIIVVLVGAALRARLYLFNRSFWLDEAYLAVNLVDRNLLELAGPLAFNQVAPYGFLVSTKLLAALLGAGEWVLRLIPFISGVIALILVLRLVTRSLAFAGSISALLLVSLSPMAIQYAAEFKQYSSDLAVAALLLLLGFRLVSGRAEGPPFFVLALVGVLVVWISLPAVLLLAGIAAADLSLKTMDRDWEGVRGRAPAYLLWGGSFLLMLPLLQEAREGLAQYALTQWSDAYAPLPPESLGDLVWFLRRYRHLFDDVVGLASWSGAAVLGVLGTIKLLRDRRRQLVVIGGVLVMTVAASGLRMYPVESRAALFLLPVAALLFGAGVQQSVSALGGYKWLATAALILFVLARPLGVGLGIATDPDPREMRQVYGRFLKDVRPSDEIYVYYGAEPMVRYYAHLLGGEDLPFHFGQRARETPEVYFGELEEHLGAERVWMLFSHDTTGPFGLERDLILSAARCYGEELLQFEKAGAYLYLYDLSDDGAQGDDRWSSCLPL